MLRNRNWKEYNNMLVRRGEVSLYIEPAALLQEKEVKKLNDGKVGRPFLYGNGLIFAGFALKCLLRFGYRQIEGAINYLLRQTNVEVPNFRTLWRRIKRMAKEGIKFNINPIKGGKKIDVAIDSTGIKRVDDGEYRTKMYDKRKGWIKLHIAVDVRNGAVLTRSITKENVHDSKETDHLLNPLYDSIENLFADGAWDSEKTFKLGKKHGFGCIVPVRINATRKCGGERRKAVIEQFDLPFDKSSHGHYGQYLRGLDKTYKTGKQHEWKEKFEYGKRWMVEGAYSKFKRMFGEYVFSKKWDMIQKEIDTKLYVYNSTILKTL
jgi:hypothetical protein